MLERLQKWLSKKYPQNFIIRRPYPGTLIFLSFIFLFAIIYKPLEIHEARFFSLEITIAIYCLLISLPLIGFVRILKMSRYFSIPEEWSILKEILSIVLILSGMGIAIYFAGFVIEESAQRWNFSTFFDSLKSSFLVGVIPFIFFTIINYRYLFVTDIVRNFNPGNDSFTPEETEDKVEIVSRLKKEELSFYHGQLLYAESEGNYVVFYLNIDNQIRKKVIRNSISNIEQQLAAIPFIMRTHRAFIVNIKNVVSQKGNTLGYRIKLSGIENEIPVSRQNTRNFDMLLKRFK